MSNGLTTVTSIQDRKPPRMELYPEQAEAKAAMLSWFEGWYNGSHDQQIFRIFGFAGVGKTTTIEATVEGLALPNGKPAFVVYGAYTGKAALVMRRAGVPANTIHSLIYVPIFPDKETCDKLKQEIKKARKASPRSKPLIKSLTDQLREASTLTFEVNADSELMKADLAVLDECSMVNGEMLQDLLGFGKPLLVLGDPGQLPPIKGTGALIDVKPDVMLTKIHRQALENPIINLSMRAREGLNIPLGEYGTSTHVAFREVSKSDFLKFDQILVGKNKTRRVINQRMREILGFPTDSPYPVVGDKLICLKNNKKRNLLNGLICKVTDVVDEYDTTIEMLILTEDDNEISVRVSKAYFDEYDHPGTLADMNWTDFRNCEEFDYGYAITVHKAQGSQWDNVGFYDDRMLAWNKIQRRRWLYTGITRAIESITLMT